MKRTVLTIGSASVLLALAACSGESADQGELGIESGRRPAPAEKRPPPGPPNAQVVTEEQAGQKTDDDTTSDDE